MDAQRKQVAYRRGHVLYSFLNEHYRTYTHIVMDLQQILIEEAICVDYMTRDF